MRRKEVKMLILYYNGIPAMLKLLDRERRELESEYNGLRGTSVDGMPHSHAPGKPTEALAEKAVENNTWERIQEISVRAQVLYGDEATIRDCLDALNGRHKNILSMKYFRGYSWARISTSLETPEATARRWNDRALDRLGEILEEVPMAEEILGRASRARV